THVTSPLQKSAAEQCPSGAAVLGQLVVSNLVRRRWHRLGGGNRFHPDAVDGSAAICGFDAVDTDLVPGPLVGIAKRAVEYDGVCFVQNHRLGVALEVKHGLTFLVLALPDEFYADVRDSRSDGLVFHVTAFEVLARKHVRCAHGMVSL